MDAYVNAFSHKRIILHCMKHGPTDVPKIQKLNKMKTYDKTNICNSTFSSCFCKCKFKINATEFLSE